MSVRLDARMRARWPLCVDLEVVSMQFANAFYNNVVRRNSVYVSSIFAGAFAFGIGFDLGVSSFWDRWNKGVSEMPPLIVTTSYLVSYSQKQWKDIRDKYVEAA